MFLDNLTAIKQDAQFDVGVNGQLGIDNGFIMHSGKFYSHGIGAHAPSVIEYELDGTYNSFECEVAINDIPADASCNPVNFLVYVDDELVAYIPQVYAHESSRRINVNIHGAKNIRLETSIQHDDVNNWCQSVWIMPQIHTENNSLVLGALGDIIIEIPDKIKYTNKCIVTVVTDNFTDKLSALLYSIKQHGNCDDVDFVVFGFGEIDNYLDIIEKYKITLIKCKYTSDFTYKIKTSALSMAQVVMANKFLYLDADMLVTGDITPIFDMLDNVEDDKILICREASMQVKNTLGEILTLPDKMYYGKPEDLPYLNMNNAEINYKLTINNGVYAGTRKAILGLESAMRATLPHSIYYEKERIDVKCFWREQGIMNIVLARLNSAVELDETYNLQLHNRDVDIEWIGKIPVVKYKGKQVKILHFNGLGREKYPELMSTYTDLSKFSTIKYDKTYNLIKQLELWYAKEQPIDLFKTEKDMCDNVFNLSSLITDSMLILDNDTAFITTCAKYLSDDLNTTSLLKNKCGAIEKYTGLDLEYQEGDILVNLRKMEDEKFDFILSNNCGTIYETYTQFLMLQKYNAKIIYLLPYDFKVNEYVQKLHKHNVRTMCIGRLMIVD
jgi:lipopolysaccharide biosynthesis glycosyltransferase